MELNVIEQKKGSLVFEIIDGTHTFCNILKKELLTDSHVKVATYAIKHPLISSPKFILETDGEDCKKALISASQRIQKLNGKFLDSFKKEAK